VSGPVGRLLPTVEAWTIWRDSLPVPPVLAEPTPEAVRVALTGMQGGVCATCLRSPEALAARGRSHRLEIDHDHGYGELVRGLLCRGCNKTESGHRYDAPHAPLFNAYRARPPASGSGWVMHRADLRTWPTLTRAEEMAYDSRYGG
jgi:hypothetical protein